MKKMPASQLRKYVRLLFQKLESIFKLETKQSDLDANSLGSGVDSVYQNRVLEFDRRFSIIIESKIDTLESYNATRHYFGLGYIS